MNKNKGPKLNPIGHMLMTYKFFCFTNNKALILKPSPFLQYSSSFPHFCNKMETTLTTTNDQMPNMVTEILDNNSPAPQMSKNAQKKLRRQHRYETKKAEKKAAVKEEKKKEGERKRKEWEEKLASVDDSKRIEIIETRKALRKERMDFKAQEREMKIQKLKKGIEFGQNLVLDLDFSHLMQPNEIHSLVQQITFCYAMNGRCASPSHLWLTGCKGEIESQLNTISGFDKWIIEKTSVSYMEALQDKKNNLVYLTADSDTIVEEMDAAKINIIGGLVDRNRWKGITMKKATDQGIQTAKLPIGNYLKMSSSQVLTVNQVIEILLKYLETKDWKTSFFHVIPQRKRCEPESEECEKTAENKDEDGQEEEQKQERGPCNTKKQCI